MLSDKGANTNAQSEYRVNALLTGPSANRETIVELDT
jgi:hypothetical protein